MALQLGTVLQPHDPALDPDGQERQALLEEDAIGKIMRGLPQTQAKHLLGFNEPDYATQANMSVDQAISLWPQLQKTGLRLGSPVTVKFSSPWLKDFMTKAKNKGLRVDFMTMHCYGWPNVDDFLGKVTSLYEMYGKPIWVTEYAVADWQATSTKPSRYSRTTTNEFMRASVAGMRAMPYVERFAWKNRPGTDPVMGNSAIFSPDGFADFHRSGCTPRCSDDSRLVIRRWRVARLYDSSMAASAQTQALREEIITSGIRCEDLLPDDQWHVDCDVVELANERGLGAPVF